MSIMIKVFIFPLSISYGMTPLQLIQLSGRSISLSLLEIRQSLVHSEPMKALVVYDSVHGNTEKIARAVAEALAPSGKARVLRAGEAQPSDLNAIDLLVVGSPTLGGRPTPAVQEFLGRMPADALRNLSVTSFDTRMKMFIARLFGFAADHIAVNLKEMGCSLARAPEGFIVKGREGPLADGELERAAAWAMAIL
jgi:flavodoxin